MYACPGVGACYRGNRLYDTPAVQAVVSKWTAFWVKYRSILVQDVIHVKRPDMQSIDCLMHVTANKTASVAALAMVYNPTQQAQNATLHLDLYVHLRFHHMLAWHALVGWVDGATQPTLVVE